MKFLPLLKRSVKRHGSKRVALAMGVTQRAVQLWLAGSAVPSFPVQFAGRKILAKLPR